MSGVAIPGVTDIPGLRAALAHLAALAEASGGDEWHVVEAAGEAEMRTLAALAAAPACGLPDVLAKAETLVARPAEQRLGDLMEPDAELLRSIVRDLRVLIR
jgi:hypothetical protein